MNIPTYSDIYDFENLYQAARETMREHRYRSGELKFNARLEENLIELQNELIWHNYEPQGDNVFTVHDPKTRVISAPQLRDRIVQSALCRVLEKYIDPKLDYDSYACRKGKGTLAAGNRAASFARKYSHFAYFDIKNFFGSIPILTLENIFASHFVEDEDMLWLLHKIFLHDCNGIGLKKGYRTSQLAANVYLNELDRFVRHGLSAKRYVRYMDDFLIFSNNENFLKNCLTEISAFLQDVLFLQLNKKSYIGRTRAGFEFVGYRIFPDYKLVRKFALQKSRTALKAWKHGKIDNAAFYKSIASRTGHCEGTASYKWQCGYLLAALKFALIDKNQR